MATFWGIGSKDYFIVDLVPQYMLLHHCKQCLAKSYRTWIALNTHASFEKTKLQQDWKNRSKVTYKTHSKKLNPAQNTRTPSSNVLEHSGVFSRNIPNFSHLFSVPTLTNRLYQKQKNTKCVQYSQNTKWSQQWLFMTRGTVSPSCSFEKGRKRRSQ